VLNCVEDGVSLVQSLCSYQWNQPDQIFFMSCLNIDANNEVNMI
jgi:hypothetical protein